MEILKMLAAPLIGAVIGYFTNFIAVKMLFFPHHEVYFLGHRVPFTPGAIPKGKPRLAKAVGRVVGTELVTKEDIKAKLLGGEIEARITGAITQELSNNIRDEICKLTKCSEETYAEGSSKLSEMLSRQIVDELSASQLPEIVVSKCNDSIEEKLSNTMFAKLIPEEKIQSFTAPLVGKIRSMIDRDGMDCVKPVIESKISDLSEKSGLELLEMIKVDEARLAEMSGKVYRSAVNNYIDKLFEKLDFAKMVEDKINDMSVEKMEDLVQTVMKKELSTIVNLGALIGFVLGLFNLILK
ncbi:MAG: DUF445 family protein [Ruminococcus sp.]|uniref:DUF445 domain-containing protein n=1 Tax=Ruminococcus sp. TaxID=41978 RepID=UPI0025DBEBC0|nr:DUF445 family protein [Ruminococcus sp.]MCR5539410.1 DUF445 family protein [Ruminococcus sp.]